MFVMADFKRRVHARCNEVAADIRPPESPAEKPQSPGWDMGPFD